MASLDMTIKIFIVVMLLAQTICKDDKKTYIVYMGIPPKGVKSIKSLPVDMVQNVFESNKVDILHHYTQSINGFVAKLTQEQANTLAGHEEVISVISNQKVPLSTTKSWDFIGFPQNVERANIESDVVIGLIDSGIWPESESFNDNGFGPPPAKWKGSCDESSNFKCNNKIIGARYYRSFGKHLNKTDSMSPRDSMGHGTHTASIAAGNPVGEASMLGLGKGTTRGGVPSARIAVYKVCWSDGCNYVDILSAIEQAIRDSVDIISISIGHKEEFTNHYHYFNDLLSIGAFHAMRHGILTVFAAGNKGPNPKSLKNLSPWSIVVGASTIDRKFNTKVQLGDDRIYEGISVNTFDLKGKLYPIIYAGDAPNSEAGFDGHSSRTCLPKSLDQKLVRGKIVLCEGNVNGSGAFEMGAAGILTQGDTSRSEAFSFLLPGCYLDSKDGAHIHKYIKHSWNPTATIFKTNELKDTLAPEVASFSSRGPNLATPEILKPDLIAPGVDIIASWSPISPVSEIIGDNRQLKFNIISGTSMACPHVSGAAGYIKSFNPTWSPAAIRSALMTTATPLNPVDNPDAEFAYGAGQINPLKAVNPGLIYDTYENDYVRFLCGQGYSTLHLRLLTRDNSTCSEASTNATTRDLNIPAFALHAPGIKSHVSGSFKRTVTNVRSPMSTYYATVVAPKRLNIQVTPSVLSFTAIGQNHTFVLTIDGTIGKSSASASLIWSDGEFLVRSPIVVSGSKAGSKSANLCYICIITHTLIYFFFISLIKLCIVDKYNSLLIYVVETFANCNLSWHEISRTICV